MNEIVQIGNNEDRLQIIQRGMVAMQELINEQAAKITAMTPYAEQAKICEGTGSAMDMTAAAGAISDNISTIRGSTVTIGRNKLYALLREIGYIRPDKNQAYQRYADQGLFKNVAPIASGHVHESVKVTPKGLQAITERMLKEWVPLNIGRLLA